MTHDCQPPTERRPVDDPMTWTCPDCGDVWAVEPLGSVNPAPSYDFGTDEVDESELPEGALAWQVIPVEQGGTLRPFISLDDLERIATDDPASVMKVLGYARTVWESVKDHPPVAYVIEERR